MKNKFLIVLWLWLPYVLQATEIQMSSYAINGAATHVVVAQSNDGKDLVYIGEIDGKLAPINIINALVAKGYCIKNPSLSYDARTIFFAAKAPAKADFDLYVSYFVKGKWSEPRLLDTTVNSQHDELSPSLSADGQTLYFVRRINSNPQERKSETTSTIFSSHIDENGRYSTPASILVSLGEEYSVTILPDNTTLLFTSQRLIKDSRPKVPYLYYSKRLLNDNWIDPVMISLNNNQRFSPSSPTYNSRTHTIYYLATSTDKNAITTCNSVAAPTDNFVLPIHHVQGVVQHTENNKPIVANITVSDIMTNSRLYSAQTHDDGFYALALPRGRNTVIDFTAPQCSHQYLRVVTEGLEKDEYETFDCNLSNQIELTFMIYDRFILEPIEANLNITDFNNKNYRDIYVEKLSETTYRTVLPLGKAYRLHFEKEGYSPYTIDLAANREIQFNRSQLDIELLPFTKKTNFEVVDATTNERIEAEIEITNRQLPEKLIFNSFVNAVVDTILRSSAHYSLNASARGYIYENQSIDMQMIDDNHTFTIALNPITQGATVQLSDVNFEYNSAEIMPASLASLEQVLRLLEMNPEINIELAAHTDDHGNEQYNLQLSQKRATSVRIFLVEKGIDPSRLKAVGYGKNKPLVPNTSDENRAKNRRVEFVIL